LGSSERCAAQKRGAAYNPRLNPAHPGGLHAGRRDASGVVPSDFVGDFPVFISSAFAQTAAGGSTQDTLMGLLPLVLMFVVLYFVMIRPQMKRQKEHKAMVEALAKGDEVVTAGGFLGKISKIGEAYVGVELASGVEVQMQRSAVTQVLPKGTMK
jgi:preprotein translocase subunit YajC